MHGIAIKKHTNAAAIAAIVGLPVATVADVLSHAEAAGRVMDADGKYMLSPAGHMILSGEYSRFYDELRADEAFVRAYEQFDQINTDLKQLITDWQTLDIAGKRMPNDHSDRDYDEKIISRIGDLHERFEPILDRMIGGEPRLTVYKSKLLAALEKAEDGEIGWVSDAKIDSYHTVWFEMHEDLLRILGRERAE
jgi:hypothetical protein